MIRIIVTNPRLCGIIVFRTQTHNKMKQLVILYSTQLFLMAFAFSFVNAAMEASSTFVTIVAMATGFSILVASVKISKTLAGIE